jgi:hypothetical protein
VRENDVRLIGRERQGVGIPEVESGVVDAKAFGKLRGCLDVRRVTVDADEATHMARQAQRQLPRPAADIDYTALRRHMGQ